MRTLKKLSRPSRVELRRRELVVIRQIVARHASLAWNEAAHAVAKTNPNGSMRKFNDQVTDAMLAEFNLRRDSSKASGTKAALKRAS
ncbi:MAG TPA: hypothetical protein VK629_11985 [Steroidobacteraceae bacterium]|nr:hypothetical protein [Steroidobacteraceae bacterium]